jgi:hypothetical protein
MPMAGGVKQLHKLHGSEGICCQAGFETEIFLGFENQEIPWPKTPCHNVGTVDNHKRGLWKGGGSDMDPLRRLSN